MEQHVWQKVFLNDFLFYEIHAAFFYLAGLLDDSLIHSDMVHEHDLIQNAIFVKGS